MRYSQTGNYDSEPLVDIEDPILVISVDHYEICPGPLDIQALVNDNLVARQRDSLTGKTGGEDDSIAVLCPTDSVPQRSRALIINIGDGKNVGKRSIRP